MTADHSKRVVPKDPFDLFESFEQLVQMPVASCHRRTTRE